MKNLIIYCALFSLLSTSCREKIFIAKVLPGAGIILNSDTICLYRTSTEKLLEVLNIADTFKISQISQSVIDPITSFDSTYVFDTKLIVFKDISFEYIGIAKDTLFLRRITLKANSDISVIIHDSIYFEQNNPPIEKVYKTMDQSDYISDDSLTYQFYSKGINFKLEKLKQKRTISEVSVYSVLE